VKGFEMSKSGGITLLGAVFLVFLVLKLTGHITWSWWWVICPLWGGVVVVLGLLVGAFIFALIGTAIYLIIRLITKLLTNK
jgi:hypothetical protein